MIVLVFQRKRSQRYGMCNYTVAWLLEGKSLITRMLFRLKLRNVYLQVISCFKVAEWVYHRMVIMKSTFSKLRNELTNVCLLQGQKRYSIDLFRLSILFSQYSSSVANPDLELRGGRFFWVCEPKKKFSFNFYQNIYLFACPAGFSSFCVFSLFFFFCLKKGGRPPPPSLSPSSATDHVTIPRRAFSFKLGHFHAAARGHFNERNKSSDLLGIVTRYVLGKLNRRAKKVCWIIFKVNCLKCLEICSPTYGHFTESLKFEECM